MSAACDGTTEIKGPSAILIPAPQSLFPSYPTPQPILPIPRHNGSPTFKQEQHRQEEVLSQVVGEHPSGQAENRLFFPQGCLPPSKGPRRRKLYHDLQFCYQQTSLCSSHQAAQDEVIFLQDPSFPLRILLYPCPGCRDEGCPSSNSANHGKDHRSTPEASCPPRLQGSWPRHPRRHRPRT